MCRLKNSIGRGPESTISEFTEAGATLERLLNLSNGTAALPEAWVRFSHSLNPKR
jgi:hypothetical protein